MNLSRARIKKVRIMRGTSKEVESRVSRVRYIFRVSGLVYIFIIPSGGSYIAPELFNCKLM